ncbi:MOSC domain-containing protein [Rubrobacter indicoceani]|uniref:MOSC domain-containing protein n=1 Tax=Rubrobacter indicoceani TaxID=2051957 RepID=UPI000E5B657E|nr:MOSC domain-containing protein [Rubrobacter indicoceani]
MSVVGTVGSLWRYPVKSMRGEEMEEVFVGFSGVYGDRHFAFKSPKRPKGFPYLTGREQEQMLRYRPGFRHPEKAAKPPNLESAESLPPGINPVDASPGEMMVDVLTPSGTTLAVDDRGLTDLLNEGVGEDLTLVRSDRALTDCRPVSLISYQTVARIGEELGSDLDHRRFRANIYLDLDGEGFGENEFVGKSLRVGDKAVVATIERDPRCKMISLDPDTGEHDPRVLRKVAQAHDNLAGVYCAVLVEGRVRKGDTVELLD